MDSTAIAVLLSWAIHLSGYPAPEVSPTIKYEPHSFFAEHACGGKECEVVGWYNDADVIYVDERYRDDESTFAASLIVHELVHFLQHYSGKFDSLSCEDSLVREREAYRVQNSYIIDAESSFAFVRPGYFSCAYEKLALNGREPEGLGQHAR